MNKLKAIIGDYENFLRIVLEDLVQAGFDLDDFVQMDHMCYRTASREMYEAKKRELAGVGTLLAESMVNARPIAAFRLRELVRYQGWRVDTIELPAPKPGKVFAEGLEHVELVLFDDQATFLRKYAGRDFDMKSAERGINPEIGLQLERCAVKFHLLNLPTVVYLEKKLGITEVSST